MLNLKDELKEYIDEGSINWNKLVKIVRCITGYKQSDECIVPIIDIKDFVSKIRGMSEISFQFIEKSRGIRQRLIIEEPKYIDNNIFVERMRIERIILAITQETNKDETPMWVDNEWYVKDGIVVYHWLGKKSYIKKDIDYTIHMMRNVMTGEIIEVDEADKDLMERVEPENKDGKIIYVKKKADV